MIVLNSNNYLDWKIKMEGLLIVKDPYELIDRKEIATGVVNLIRRFFIERQWQWWDSLKFSLGGSAFGEGVHLRLAGKSFISEFNGSYFKVEG